MIRAMAARDFGSLVVKKRVGQRSRLKTEAEATSVPR
jgi:hypothetical protein